MSDAATDKMMEDEANALAKMLATDKRCVMVIVIVAEDNGVTSLTQGVAGITRGSHLRQFIEGVERKLEYLKAKLHRRA